jgi:citrate synthase
MDKLIKEITGIVNEASQIDKGLFEKFDVKRGLRNSDGTGVLVGLTKVGSVVGYRKEDDGKVVPVPGELRYRGYMVNQLADSCRKEKRHGFEETVFLLIAGRLPTQKELDDTKEFFGEHADLDENITQMILNLSGKDMMNMLSRSVLGMYTLDETAEDYSLPSLVHQAFDLIAKLPAIVIYSYYGMQHRYNRKTLKIRHPKAELTFAENFLFMLKGADYTKIEADLLDLTLVLHADHGGGNNSTFTTRVISSAMTDTYSAIAGAIGSLKGRLHGGANLRVLEMMENIKNNVNNWKDETEVKNYLLKILGGKANDGSGKIYGVGHAVYTISDPRAVVLKERARSLAEEKGLEDEFNLYCLIEDIAAETFNEFKGGGVKTVCVNVDFYSGFVYEAIGIPKELFTPLFAISRMSGWSAHRLEEVTCESRRIIRPAYKNALLDADSYTPIDKR